MNPLQADLVQVFLETHAATRSNHKQRLKDDLSINTRTSGKQPVRNSIQTRALLPSRLEQMLQKFGRVMLCQRLSFIGMLLPYNIPQMPRIDPRLPTSTSLTQVIHELGNARTHARSPRLPPSQPRQTQQLQHRIAVAQVQTSPETPASDRIQSLHSRPVARFRGDRTGYYRRDVRPDSKRTRHTRPDRCAESPERS
jgi:hypothetical protein